MHDAETAVDYDLYLWDKVNALRVELAKDTVAHKGIFTRIANAIAAGDYDTASLFKLKCMAK